MIGLSISKRQFLIETIRLFLKNIINYHLVLSIILGSMLFPLLLKYIWYKYTKSLVRLQSRYYLCFFIYLLYRVDDWFYHSTKPDLQSLSRSSQTRSHTTFIFLKNVLRVLQFFRMLPILPIKNAPIFQYWLVR